MSLLATIYQCDGCTRIAVLRSNLDYTTFEKTWHDGFDHSFCPVCREKPDNKELIDHDGAMDRAVSIACRKYSREVPHAAH